MELRNIFTKTDPQEDEKRFLAIEINAENIKTSVWAIRNKTSEIVSVGTIEDWSGQAVTELVTAVDASLSKALEAVDPEPHQVLFGLPESWVTEDGIADSRKVYLKAITDKLDLQAVGFVVTSEAIVQYLKKKEGGPIAAVLIGFGESELTVTLVTQGEIQSSEIVGRSEDIVADVQEGIARFQEEKTLPSRILLYDGNQDLETIKQNLLTFEWEKVLPFLHVPKIEVLDPDTSIFAISISGGMEVARSIGLEVLATVAESAITPEATKETASPVSDTPHPVIPNKAAEFGFEEVDEAAIGFENQEDSSENTKFAHEDDNIVVPDEDPLEYPEADDEIAIASSSRLNAFSKLFQNPLKRLKRRPSIASNESKPKRLKPLLFIGPIVLLLLLGAGIWAYWNLPKAEVTVYVGSKNIDKSLQFSLATDSATVDGANNTIPAVTDSVEVSGTKEIATTGKVTVGEKAKGTVTLYNRTQSKKTFEAGTVLTVDKIKFTLDETVSIASASTTENSDFTTTIKPTGEDVAVTAQDIGEDYNRPKDTLLTVANFAESSFVAKAKTDLAGGFAKEVQAVAKTDREQLLSSLSEELKQQAVAQVEAKKSSNKGVVAISEPEVVEQKFSAKAGEEAEKLTLNLAIKQPIYTYEKEDVIQLAQKQSEGQIPANFALDPEKVSVEILNSSVEDKVAKVEANVVLPLVPRLNKAEIISSIKGKYPPVTEAYFASLPNFKRVETEFNFSLPSRLKTFPRKAENIELIVKVEHE